LKFTANNHKFGKFNLVWKFLEYMKEIKIIIVGAGNRGTGYASLLSKYPDMKIVGLAEPREFYRNKLAGEYNIPKENVYLDWKDLADRERFADAAIIATQDEMHVDPAIAFAEKGYHILLEKPMAPSESECQRLYENLKNKDIIFGVCHVLRYTPYTRKLKQILDSGQVGEIISMQHLEPVGYWHQAHSFVRGNWRRKDQSTFMLLAKSCHDIDWIYYIMGEKCKSISSFGSLKYFRKENKPNNAGDFCFNCGHEKECPYSAIKVYLNRAKSGNFEWPVDVITSNLTVEGVEKAIKTGPYGRCVFNCDNDVVDNQTVNMQFENNSTVIFTMTAFTALTFRRTSIFCTGGEIYGDGDIIKVYDFLTDTTKIISVKEDDLAGSHYGGDYGLVESFVKALRNNDKNELLSGLEESIYSHNLVFAAERARMENRVVEI
jgi:predicted dehydrogenase